MIGRLLTLETNNSQADLVRLLKPGEVFRAGGLDMQKPVKRGLTQLGLQLSAAVVIPPEPSEACPHKTDESFDFKREVSAFVENALGGLSIPLGSCFADER